MPLNATELANRGKKAEAAVQGFLKALKEKERSFDYQRQYDARAAGGRFNAQTGDYLIFHSGKHGALEVKELHHDYRLPTKNFSGDQIARLRRREMAGGIIVIAVFHTTTQLWRLPAFSFFKSNMEIPSWNLSEFETFTDIKLALSSHPFWNP